LSFVLSRTAFGAKIYLLGANVIASRFAGIDNRAVTIKTYVLSGAYSAVAGLVIAARVNSAKADYGAAYLLLSILICVLGGINPFGGSGRISGVVLAVLALQFLSSGLNLVGVNNFATEMVWGGVLLAAMALNQSALLRRK
jgi:simple sugar transport system permease protein